MKRKTKRRYCYLLERKTDGKHFCAFGNFKATSYDGIYKKQYNILQQQVI